MPISCEFQLDHDNSVYTAGEDVNGRVILRTQKVILANAVFITLEGEAVVQWSKGDDGSATSYYGKQQLLNHEVKVFDGTYFRAGRHVFRISLLIPPNCPSTCEGRYGRISYNISVRLARHWSFDKVFRTSIIVQQALDLNNNPEYMLPVKDENIKFFCRWPCRSGPILSSLVIPIVGYIPEQNIPFTLNIDNQSQYDIGGIEATLYQHFVFSATNPNSRMFYKKTVGKIVIDKSTLRLSKRLYEGALVVPPNMQRSTLNDSIIVSLHYELHVKIKTGRLHYDIDMKVPIIIGTVELRQWHNDDTMVLMPPQSTAFTGQRSSSSPNSAGILNDNVELPSYESCSSPPNFAIATSSSPHSVRGYQQQTNDQQRLSINLQQFPGYNTFRYRIQAENNANNLSNNIDYEANFREDLLLAEWRSLHDFAEDRAIGPRNINEENNL